jgi:integrating conjugative element protein (TIGR03749 family)
LRVQNNNGTLYFLAKKPFALQRVVAKLRQGTMILLDITAEPNADITPLEIVLSKNDQKESLSASVTAVSDQMENTPIQRVNYVELNRYAVQRLFAPKRLLKESHHIYRVPMRTKKTVPLMLDGSIVAMPLVSWRSGDITITAVMIRNHLQQPLILDPRRLCGDWLSATFYPRNQLTPEGTATDSTTVFLMAKQPFHQALQLCF